MTTGAARRPGARRLLRPRNVLVAVLALVAALGARMVYRWITAVSAPIVDYAAQLEALAGAHQPPGPNGWADLEAALLAFAEAEAALADDTGALNYDLPRILMDEFEEWEGSGPMGLAPGSPDLAAMEALMAAGAFDGLDAVAAAPRFVRPIDAGGGPLFGVMLSNLASTRSLARARASSMRLAAVRGDAAEQVRAFEHLLAIARAESSQPILIERLVGMAIAQLATGELRHELAERPIDEATGRALLAAMDRQVRWPSMALRFEGERLFMRDMIQHCFTDDGHGDGHLDIGKMNSLGGGPSPALGSAAGLLLAGRAETCTLTDEFYDRLVEGAGQSRPQRAAGGFDADAFIEGLSYRHLFLQQMLPATAHAQSADDRVRVETARTQLMIAIETYRAIHGRVPASLDDLVPGVLPAPIVDPATGDPFVYSVREADAPGLPYDYDITSASDLELPALVAPRR
jgi:hypothetical protein